MDLNSSAEVSTKSIFDKIRGPFEKIPVWPRKSNANIIINLFSSLVGIKKRLHYIFMPFLCSIIFVTAFQSCQLT